MARPHYPRTMYHRTKPPVTVHSWAEEYALGAEWRRTVWPQGGDYQAAIPTPELSTVSAVPETDAAPGGSGDDPPGAPHPPERPQLRYNKLPPSLALAAEAARKAEPEPSAEPELKAGTPLPPKRYRAPTVKPTGKVKRKYGRD